MKIFLLAVLCFTAVLRCNGSSAPEEEVEDFKSFMRWSKNVPQDVLKKVMLKEAEEQDPVFFNGVKMFIGKLLGKGLPKECPIAISTSRKRCNEARTTDIKRARMWYQLTNSKSNTDFPRARQIPWLAHNVTAVKTFYLLDPFEYRSLVLFGGFEKLEHKIMIPALMVAFKKYPFVTWKEYVELSDAFSQQVKNLKTPQYYANPSQSADFTDHIHTGYWKTDDAFTQRRLAAQCPYFLKKVITSGKNGLPFADLKSILNPRFFKIYRMQYGKKWISITEAAKMGRLFVLRIPEMDDIENINDLMNQTENTRMAKIRSTVSLFLLRPDGTLRISAIQQDPKPNSPVFTHVSNHNDWMTIKGKTEMMADGYCQAGMHFGRTHLTSTVWCLTFRRHISTQHPLYNFLKYHCEGTVPHISTSFTILTTEGTGAHNYYGMGHKGFLKIGTHEWNNRNYDKYDIDYYIKANGLDDPNIKYFPFRDDAKLLMAENALFVDEIIKHVYGNSNKKLRNDKEFQAWINEVSSKGKPALGVEKEKMMKNFPSTFRTIAQLKKFMNRFLFINIFHTTTNYPMAPDFLPLSPTKLYEYEDGKKMPFQIAVPHQVKFTVGMTILKGIIANVRINRIFDYWPGVTDLKYRALVRKAWFRMKEVQKTLAKRNADRKAKNQLGYQYIEPRWLTNSVHI
ncbi:hydroperoxide isomerase ALOXE3-like [Clytia hemisphaerica]|uniref:Lipoxygenase domain-containing protein n=1 Tax=Clytia hemisphaerica TaxID=252671 RepID=A0A7M5UZJ1_9CNID|eukprot:TCONS_00033718-protein